MSFEELRKVVADALEVEPGVITPTTRLESLPTFDSVARLSLIAALEDAGVSVPMAKAAEIASIEDVMRLAGVTV